MQPNGKVPQISPERERLLCNKFSQDLEVKTPRIYYLVVSADRESRGSLAGRFWLRVCCEAAVDLFGQMPPGPLQRFKRQLESYNFCSREEG